MSHPGGKQRYKSPSGDILDIPNRFRHKLGTDGIGRDLKLQLNSWN